MIGTVILCALLAAAFWAVITGRLRLGPEREPMAWYVHEAPDGSLRFTPTEPWRVVPAPPFDWSEHADL